MLVVRKRNYHFSFNSDFLLGNVFGPGSRKVDKQPPVKKKRIDTSGDWMASDVLDIQDIDLEVYGRTDIAPTSHRYPKSST